MNKFLNKIYRFLFSRFFMLSVIFLAQLVLFIYIILSLTYSYTYWEYGIVLSGIINFILTCLVINEDKNPTYKLAWIIIINCLPATGGLVYLLFSNHKISKKLRIETSQKLIKEKGLINQNSYCRIADDDIYKQFYYIQENAYYPYYQNTKSQYFNSGESCFAQLKNDLKKAREFIFLEFFIVKNGEMYQEIRDILREKTAEGVEVFFIYDDGGSIISDDFPLADDLRSIDVNVAVFSPVSLYLLLLSKTNNRDHRKIIVIDNEIAYVGGLNIGDEYINRIKRFGYWKDSAIRLQGDAVTSFSLMFIQIYNAFSKEEIKYEKYLRPNKTISASSYILPFSDAPTDGEDIAYSVHLNLINHAGNYIYICTPYLILDYTMMQALCLAAKQGVDVRIITPHIPDKKIVSLVTKSNYLKLLEAGVRIYEFTPGFIHSKMIVSDDKIALEGTINMDFRSYYLHFECGVLLAQDPAIKIMREDFINTLKVSQEITWQDEINTKLSVRLVRALFSVLAPLL